MNEPNKSGMSSSMKRAPQNDNCLLLFPQHKNSRVLRWSHMMIWNIKSTHPGSSPAGQIQVQKWTPETRGCRPAFCERFYPFLFFNFINWHQFCLVRTTSMSESEPRRLATGVSWRRVFLPRAQKNPHHRSQKSQWNVYLFELPVDLNRQNCESCKEKLHPGNSFSIIFVTASDDLTREIFIVPSHELWQCTLYSIK